MTILQRSSLINQGSKADTITSSKSKAMQRSHNLFKERRDKVKRPAELYWLRQKLGHLMKKREKIEAKSKK